MLNLRRIEVFCEVVDAGSLGLVAARQHVTQPVISRMLDGLDEHFGTQLLQRQGRRLVVTEEGWIVYRLAKDVIRAEREAQRMIQELGRGDAGLISLAVTDSIGSYIMPALWARFHEQHPRANLALRIHDSETVMALVLEGSVDLGIGVAREIPRGLVTEKLGDRISILVAPPRHRLAGTKRVCAEDLAGERFLCSIGAYHWSLTDTSLRVAGLVGSYSITQFGDSEAVKRAVRQGIGLAFLSRCAVQEELTAGQLCELTLEGVAAVSTPTVLARRADTELRLLQSAFWRFLQDQAAQIVL